MQKVVVKDDLFPIDLVIIITFFRFLFLHYFHGSLYVVNEESHIAINTNRVYLKQQLEFGK